MLDKRIRDYNVTSIDKIAIFYNDVQITRIKPDRKRPAPKRSEITEFSYKSRKRLAFVAANTSIIFTTMITLTYPSKFETNGKKVKKHLHAMLKRMNRRIGSFEYLWFIEFQRRGAPHFHCLLDIPNSQIDKLKISRDWYEIVGSKDIRHLVAGTRCEKLRKPGGFYAVKYAYKMNQKIVPENYRNVGRFYGYSKGVEPLPIIEINAGDIDKIFANVPDYMNLLESGYTNLFGLSAQVISNILSEHNETT